MEQNRIYEGKKLYVLTALAALSVELFRLLSSAVPLWLFEAGIISQDSLVYDSNTYSKIASSLLPLAFIFVLGKILAGTKEDLIVFASSVYLANNITYLVSGTVDETTLLRMYLPFSAMDISYFVIAVRIVCSVAAAFIAIFIFKSFMDENKKSTFAHSLYNEYSKKNLAIKYIISYILVALVSWGINIAIAFINNKMINITQNAEISSIEMVTNRRFVYGILAMVSAFLINLLTLVIFYLAGSKFGRIKGDGVSFCAVNALGAAVGVVALRLTGFVYSFLPFAEEASASISEYIFTVISIIVTVAVSLLVMKFFFGSKAEKSVEF